MKQMMFYRWVILLLLISLTQAKAQNYKTIKLDANQEQVDLLITPIVDALIEDYETADFRLEDSQDYLVSGIRSAQIGLFDAPAPPDITGFAPVQVNPGMNLLIRGHGFVGVTTVSFNGVLAEFTVDSPNQITAVVPLKAGSGPIAVGTPAGGAASSTELQVVNDASLWTRSWDLQNSGGANQNLNAVAFGDGLYVAVGAGGRIMTSPDAIKWTTQRSPTSMDIYGIASGALNGVHWFVATAGGDTREMGGLILKSKDGLNWQTNVVERPVLCVAYSGKSFLVGGDSYLYQSNDLINWNKSSNPKSEDSWSDIIVGLTYGGDQFIMTTDRSSHPGTFSKIFTSVDGVKWQKITDSGSSRGFRYGFVSYGPDLGYLVVGYFIDRSGVRGSNGNYCYDCYNPLEFWDESRFFDSKGFAHVGSLDGKTWTQNSMPNGINLFGVTYGDGTFVAVGNNGTVSLTSDGIAWQNINAGTDRRLRSIVYGGGQFVAVGQNGIIVSSKYGSDWTIRSPKTDLQIRDKVLRSIVEGSLGTVAVGDGGTLLVSRDGNTWTQAPSGGTVLEHIPGDFTWSQAKADAAARGGRLARKFVFVDLATKVGWLAASDQGAEGQWRWEGAGDTVSGIPWLTGQPNGGLNENYAFWNGNGGVEDRPGNQANGYFIERVNEWDRGINLTGVAYGLGRYVVVGSGRIYSAVDPSVWRLATGDSKANFQVVRFLNGMFVALGDDGAISTSTDGLAWAARSSGVTTSLRDVTFANNKFVAVGLGGTIITSADTINWKKIETGNVTDLYGVTAGMGQFVIVGDNLVWTSDNGDIWRLRSLSDRQLRTVQFVNNQFIAAGVNGRVTVSADARSWTTPIWLGEAWKRTFTAVTIGQGRAWLIGEQGTILRSGKLDLVASVFITALDATASEVGPRPARIQIRRSGDLSKPLTVRIRIDGTAKELDDYVITGPLLR